MGADEEICREMVRHGMRPSTFAMQRRTPLHWAAVRNKYSLARFLVATFPEMRTMADLNGRTPRDLAQRYYPNKKIVAIL